MKLRKTLFFKLILFMTLSLNLSTLFTNTASAQQNKKIITNEDISTQPSPKQNNTLTLPTSQETPPITQKKEYESQKSTTIKMPTSGFTISVPFTWKTGSSTGNLFGLGQIKGVESISPQEEIGLLFTDSDHHQYSQEYNIEFARNLFESIKKQTEKQGGNAQIKETKINGLFVLTIETTILKTGTEEKSISAVYFKEKKCLLISGVPSKHYDRYKSTLNEILNSVK